MVRRIARGATLILALAGYSLHAQDSGQAKHRSLRVGEMNRSYLLYLPADTTRPVPLILAFHGGAATAESMAKYVDLDEKALEAGFAVAYPAGYEKSWNAGPGPDGKSPNWGRAFDEKLDDIGFVRALLEDVGKVVRIDPQRIFVCGISNGAAMAYRVAVELSDRIAAVAGVVSEVSLQNPKPSRPVPMMHFWGTADKLQRGGSPPAAERTARHLRTWLGLNRCADDKEVFRKGAATRDTYKPGPGGADVVLWTVEGMGHCWPGVGGPVTDRVLGPPNYDISATDEMIAFFRAHRLPSAGSGSPK